MGGPPGVQGCHGEEDGITTSDVCGGGGGGVPPAMGNALHVFGGVRLEEGNTGGNQQFLIGKAQKPHHPQ